MESPASHRGSVDVLMDGTHDIGDAIVLTAYIEKMVDSHQDFKVRPNSARLTAIWSAWRATVIARRRYRNDYREIYGEGPTAELAVDSLVEGLDHWAEVVL